ncbi:MAG: YdeI/OmpD-associated family protein [Flavisolibacter sp.]
MISFATTILKFDQQGEKTGWTYISVPGALAQKLKQGNKKSFRVKGWLDAFPIKGVALIPMGGGDFIMALNASMRKGIRKQKGAVVQVVLEEDEEELKLSPDLMVCLADEPAALTQFRRLPKGHQRYFSNWVESGKTAPTKAKRIAHAIRFLSEGKNFGEMLRAIRQEKEDPKAT